MTAFPPKLSGEKDKAQLPNPYDELDVFDKIIKSLKVADTNKYENANMLACHIIDRCAGNIVDEALTEESKFQFIEYFDKDIDNQMERQRQLLNQLGEEIKQDPRDTLSKENPFNIEAEFGILKAIRDIEEEIHMMTHVLEQQLYAIRLFERKQRHIAEEDPLDDIPFEGGTLAPPSEMSHPVAKKVQRDREVESDYQMTDLLSKVATSLETIAGAFVTEDGKKSFVQTVDLGEGPYDTPISPDESEDTQSDKEPEQNVQDSVEHPEASHPSDTNHGGSSKIQPGTSSTDMKDRSEKARVSAAIAARRAVQRAEDRLGILKKMYRKAEHVEQSVKA